jgi:hypothetical protein
MVGGEVFRTLLSFLWSAFDGLPDTRRGKNTLKDAEDSIKVNWVELVITNAKGKGSFRTS